MLRYAFQKGYANSIRTNDRWMVTCKSSNPDRIKDNCNIFDFELSDSQMKELDELECDFRVTPGPKDPEERKRYYEDMP
jgi:diketogulonate reductase-like aldo/keto reductase